MIITFGFGFRCPSVTSSAAAGAARVNDFESVVSRGDAIKFEDPARCMTPTGWPVKCGCTAIM